MALADADKERGKRVYGHWTACACLLRHSEVKLQLTNQLLTHQVVDKVTSHIRLILPLGNPPFRPMAGIKEETGASVQSTQKHAF